MSDLSAKVFRTFNASFTLQNELDKSEFNEKDDLEAKVSFYNEANKQVAILCNHQKTVSKTHGATMDSWQNNLKEHIEYMMDLTEHLQSFKKGKKKEKNDKKRKESEEDKTAKGKLKKVLPDTKEKTESVIEKLKGKIGKMEKRIKEKENLKEVALGTSKLNYMDPRITVSWCKKHEVPIDRVFAKGVREKFPWAMYANHKYSF